MSKSKWYWRLQAAGWTLYGVIDLVINQMFSEGVSLSDVLFSFSSAGMMLLSSHFLRFLIKKYRWMNLSFGRLVLRVFGVVLAASLLINLINSLYLVFVSQLFSLEDFSIPFYLLYVFQTLIYFFLWFGVYFGIFYFRNYKNEEIERWKLQSSLKDAELIALKAQINPHFLFNALNNIRALILEDQMKARDMVSNLSELLRYSIHFSQHEKVKVSEEVEVVRKYLELERIHYEERLDYEVNMHDEAKDCNIPPMSVQLLVENAVKHGISQVKGGGLISITIRKEDSLYLEVRNTGTLAKDEMKGIGIKNVTERIRILFEKPPTFNLTQEGNMVKSILKLPAEK